MKLKCLVIDDEEHILELLVMTLERMNLECYTAETIHQARNQLKNIEFDLCLTDMKLPDGDGIDLVAHIQENCPNLPVAVITAFGNIELAVQALKAGAFDFISKPVDLTILRKLVTTALRLSEERNSILPNFVGTSKEMEALKDKIKKIARSQAPIYITGESGSGKEVVARMIHGLSVRADKPFVPVNCGAIPTELMESEFFGHKKGSFTGATGDKAGLFQTAQGGTLFLDEVGDLPLLMQVKLLRAIQEKRIRPVGAQKEISVDVRILSATNRDLAQLVKDGEFRQDLFYRLNVIDVFVPPLREHRHDIPDLVNSILKRLVLQASKNTRNLKKPHLSAKAEKTLMNYPFPGNIRELENILERAMTLCENDVIEVKDLHLINLEEGDNDEKDRNEVLSISNKTSDNSRIESLDPLLEDMEKEKILKALEKTKGNKTKAAKLLGIGFGALRYRLSKIRE